MKYLGLGLSGIVALMILIVFFQNVFESKIRFHFFFAEWRIASSIPFLLGFVLGMIFIVGLFIFFKKEEGNWEE